jgi:ABC-2 type transport system permease protein
VGPTLLLLRKDLRLRIRDRSVFLFGIVVPLGLTVLFSNIFPDLDDLQITAAVVDEDGSDVAAGFTDGVVPVLVEDGLVVLAEDVDDRTSAIAAMRDGELDAVWLVPAGFGDEVTAGRPAVLEVLVNPDRALAGEVARGVATAYTTRLETVSLAVATTTVASGGPLDPSQLQAVVDEVGQAAPPIALDLGESADRQLDPLSYLAAGMAAFFVFFTVQYGVTGLLEEEKLGTLPRLLASPIPPWSVQAGKALGSAVLGLVSLLVLAMASRLLLGADWGPPVGVGILLVALVVAAVGLMGLVGSFARTAEQASNSQAIVAIVLGMSGGVFFPIPTDTVLLRVLGAASPHAWFLRGLGDLVGTGRWTAALPAAAAIAAFGVVAAVPAVWLLRRRRTW